MFMITEQSKKKLKSLIKECCPTEDDFKAFLKEAELIFGLLKKDCSGGSSQPGGTTNPKTALGDVKCAIEINRRLAAKREAGRKLIG